ncbi:MAG: hypothetical protein WBL67_08575 [Nitrososphaeraceae archaeon]
MNFHRKYGIGASVTAQKELGIINSVVKEGGYTTNSFLTVDGSFSIKIPSGVYQIPDGTNQIIENYAVWPSSESSFNFENT